MVETKRVASHVFEKAAHCLTGFQRSKAHAVVLPEGSARDYGIADAQMLRNAAAREEENQ